jgi:hypothetical protein
MPVLLAVACRPFESCRNPCPATWWVGAPGEESQVYYGIGAHGGRVAHRKFGYNRSET